MKNHRDRGCSLEKNESGLYDLQINGNDGTLILNVRNVPFLTAIGLIEKHFDAERSEGRTA